MRKDPRVYLAHILECIEKLPSGPKAERSDTLAILNPEVGSQRHNESANPWLRLRHARVN